MIGLSRAGAVPNTAWLAGCVASMKKGVAGLRLRYDYRSVFAVHMADESFIQASQSDKSMRGW